MRDKLLTILVSLILLFAILLLANGCANNDDEVDWFVSVSPDGGHEIRVTLIGDTFTFGAQRLGVYGNGQLLFNDEIANDGKNLHKYNYSIEWNENVASLSFSGEEQKTAVYSIDFSGEDIITKTVVDKWSSIPNDAAAAID